MRIIGTIIPRNLVANLLSSHFSLHKNQKQESHFQQVGGLVTRKSFDFCLKRVALYLKGVPNSIDFYKMIFLLVIPYRIIVPSK